MSTVLEKQNVQISNKMIICDFVGTNNSSFDFSDERCCYCQLLSAFYLKHRDKIENKKHKNDLIEDIYMLFKIYYKPTKCNYFEKINAKAIANFNESISKLIEKSKKEEIQKAFLFNKMLVHLWKIETGKSNPENIDKNGNRFFDKRCYTCPILVDHMKNELKQQARSNTIELKKLTREYYLFLHSPMAKKICETKEKYNKVKNNYEIDIKRLEYKKSRKELEEEWLINYQCEQDALWEIRRPKPYNKPKELKNDNREE